MSGTIPRVQMLRNFKSWFVNGGPNKDGVYEVNGLVRDMLVKVCGAAIELPPKPVPEMQSIPVVEPQEIPTVEEAAEPQAECPGDSEEAPPKVETADAEPESETADNNPMRRRGRPRKY